MKKSYITPETTVNQALGDLLLEQLPVSVTEVPDGYGKDREDSPAESEESEQKDTWSNGLW